MTFRLGQSPLLQCPRCGKWFDSGLSRAGVPFRCPICDGELYISRMYPLVLLVVTLGCAIGISVAIGMRGSWLLIGIAAFAVIFSGLVALWATRLFPPRIQPHETPDLSWRPRHKR
jgi:hypothetical protein